MLNIYTSKSAIIESNTRKETPCKFTLLYRLYLMCTMYNHFFVNCNLYCVYIANRTKCVNLGNKLDLFIKIKICTTYVIYSISFAHNFLFYYYYYYCYYNFPANLWYFRELFSTIKILIQQLKCEILANQASAFLSILRYSWTFSKNCSVVVFWTCIFKFSVLRFYPDIHFRFYLDNFIRIFFCSFIRIFISDFI